MRRTAAICAMTLATLAPCWPAAAAGTPATQVASAGAPDTARPVSASPDPAKPARGPQGPSEGIVAVVNGDVVSGADVEARARLFALSTGLPFTPEVLARLRPQVTKQLIDERLRLQEEQRRKVIVTDKQISEAIMGIETRNGMPSGTLRRKLGDQGVALRTLIDQVRVQLGWTQVLRDELGDKTQISDTDIAEQQAIQKARAGQPEYHVGEIFLPVDDPAKAAETQRFAEQVAQQLRGGAPFAVVAAQFSQSQTALQGGDLGWVNPTQLDPQIASLIPQMPEGAISNPVQVPGGYTIVAMNGKREVGRDVATMMSLRQVFLAFNGPLNPAAPTEQQRKTLEQATALSKSIHGCDAMEAAAKANNSSRPVDPGDVRMEGLSGPMRTLLASLTPGEASKPLVSSDGIALVMICTSAQKNLAEGTKEDISNRLLNDRVELVSRQLVRDLRRRAVLDQRS